MTPIRDLLLRGVRQGIFSGAQASLARRGRSPLTVCAGTTSLVEGSPVERGTLFDIASVTKVFTCAAALRMVDRGELDPDARIQEILGELKDRPVGKATLAQLMAHEAGFEPWVPFFERIERKDRGTAGARREMIRMIMDHPAVRNPGEEAAYSDLGYILLGEILGARSGRPLDEIIAAEVTGPLRLTSVRFAPVRGAVAATEDCPWRGRVISGEVHDDNAWTMGGLAGHAGLFGPAVDVARFGAAWLEALETGEWLSRELVARSIAPRPLGRGLGWDLKSPRGSSAGDLMGERTFGHLGFTGCSLWVDPDAGLSVALLTNRVHPSRDNEAIREFRPRFHDLVVETNLGAG